MQILIFGKGKNFNACFILFLSEYNHQQHDWFFPMVEIQFNQSFKQKWFYSMFNLFPFFVLIVSLFVLMVQNWPKIPKPWGVSAEGHLERFDPPWKKYKITQLFEIIDSVHLNHCSSASKREGKKRQT